MSLYNKFILKMRRGEGPFFRLTRTVVKSVFYFTPPRLPRPVLIPLRLLYELHWLIVIGFRWMVANFYAQPLFQSRCTTVGRNLRVTALPFVSGHLEIHLGDDVLFDGPISIMSGRWIEKPKLVIGDRSGLGYNTTVVVNREIVIEEDVIISYDCRISDSDGHPRQADLRAQHAPLDPRDIRPVRICRYAWIGNGTHIMKGVTIGEGAIIGANSVVISDIPPYSLALGNPAEVYFRNVGRPKNRHSSAAAGHAQRSSAPPQE